MCKFNKLATKSMTSLLSILEITNVGVADAWFIRLVTQRKCNTNGARLIRETLCMNDHNLIHPVTILQKSGTSYENIKWTRVINYIYQSPMVLYITFFILF